MLVAWSPMRSRCREMRIRSSAGSTVVGSSRMYERSSRKIWVLNALEVGVDLQRLRGVRRLALSGDGLCVAAAACGQERGHHRELDATSRKLCHAATVQTENFAAVSELLNPR